MDPLRFSLAVGPLAVYLLFIGLVQLRRRPFLTTGTRDLAALGLALAGFAVIGPLELFMPENAASVFGWMVWGPLLVLYGLGVLLVLLAQRPRLVIYNMTVDELRPVLAQAVSGLDGQARWAGDNLVMPQLGVQLHVDPQESMRTVSLVATGERQSLVGWQKLAAALRPALKRSQVGRNPRGLAFLGLGLLLFSAAYGWLVLDPAQVAQRMAELLRL
jgi:hypothetical protein